MKNDEGIKTKWQNRGNSKSKKKNYRPNSHDENTHLACFDGQSYSTTTQ